ncbi:Protein ILRUN [Pseudolycoriella hygida]|uniref:Protein ILRUN n=1 Tax=Pseudolycoriella hygida TaxID=35572 RepID=A0A9Q0RZS0_9DIPT|nr:Protein ILRUN [Pseudolycoriella hygida]
MDIDENSGQGPPPSQGGDIDTSFLQQFSCLGTTDHDELILQLQRVLGNQLNYTTARFFLDMNNWNLQAAVGCYFDFNSGQKLPSMRVVEDITFGYNEAVPPSTNFIQSWRIQNSGDEDWPNGCFLKCTNHSQPDTPVTSLRAGEQTVISVTLVSPNYAQTFQTKWRMCTSYGNYFGEAMWSIVQVKESGTLALTQQLMALRTSNLGNNTNQSDAESMEDAQNTAPAYFNAENK